MKAHKQVQRHREDIYSMIYRLVGCAHDITVLIGSGWNQHDRSMSVSCEQFDGIVHRDSVETVPY